jgi:hypothetical protein
MKLTIPAILATVLIVAPTIVFAQNSMGYRGTSSNPATAESKDETTSMAKHSKKHMASHKTKHHVKRTSSKPETTGIGSSSTKKY